MIEDVMPGGGFLVAPIPLGKIFTREQFSDDQREFADTAKRFMQNEVIPKADAIENKEMDGDRPLALSLLEQMGELGLFGIDLPEEYGGLGLDKTTGAILAETMAGMPSFATTAGAHSGIGTLPIVFFGNEAQKAEWLPKLATGEKISCYGLTEPSAGSDALSGRTTATPTEDGKFFLLNGEKQFITNGSWADVSVVFAQVDGKYTGFIVDLHSPGVTRGAEEHKMGIKGSSTTALVFEDVKVPAENMLGKPGMAPQIALNILNLGRLKLGFGALGNAKYAIDLTTEYAAQRKQFGQPIISFDMQKGRLADMAADTFALDSVCYRAVGSIDAALARLAHDESYVQRLIETFRAHALECSIVKVTGAETLQAVLDRAIRMHGGYGFIHDYKVEMLARDNVVDNIYEGTNDINRLTIFDGLARNILGAGIPFREYMEQVDAELRAGKVGRLAAEGPLAEEIADVMAAKRAVAFTVNHAIIHCGKDIKNEQQVMEAVADLLITLMKMESTVARVHLIVSTKGESKAAAELAIARLVCYRGGQLITGKARDVLLAVAPAGQRQAKLASLKTLLESLERPVNVVTTRRIIADAVIEAGGYQF